MEEQIRLAAFNWLKEQVTLHGDILPRSLLVNGFHYNGERVTLIGPQGIWKPKIFHKIPISIATVCDGPYDDSLADDGSFIYRYRGTDPFHRDNVGLREAMKKQIPLIYFFGIVPSKYLAVWPVYIVNDNPNTLSFTVVADDMASIQEHLLKPATGIVSNESEYAIRRYITSSVKERLHQKSFRERVLLAYRQQCAFCRLKHAQLLDAAHIIPDGEELGDPIVTNGLSLCKIHHAAYDTNIIGVTPDYRIEVREDILYESDGPMLKHGIQALQSTRIILPRDKNAWPDKERLSIKYSRFLQTG
ncbi:MAG: HNH endonuclease [Clostridiaceae bacterium]|jgi:putative restriction endonuclease|nr:HNH endonuclease [Clostridiaceae bacterium]